MRLSLLRPYFCLADAGIAQKLRTRKLETLLFLISSFHRYIVFSLQANSPTFLIYRTAAAVLRFWQRCAFARREVEVELTRLRYLLLQYLELYSWLRLLRRIPKYQVQPEYNKHISVIRIDRPVCHLGELAGQLAAVTSPLSSCAVRSSHISS